MLAIFPVTDATPAAEAAKAALRAARAVTELVDEPLEALGAFSFRGVAEPVAVFAARE